MVDAPGLEGWGDSLQWGRAALAGELLLNPNSPSAGLEADFELFAQAIEAIVTEASTPMEAMDWFG